MIDARTDEFNLVMSASESHNLANLRMTRAQSFAALSDVNALALQDKAVVNVSLSCLRLLSACTDLETGPLGASTGYERARHRRLNRRFIEDETLRRAFH